VQLPARRRWVAHLFAKEWHLLICSLADLRAEALSCRTVPCSFVLSFPAFQVTGLSIIGYNQSKESGSPERPAELAAQPQADIFVPLQEFSETRNGVQMSSPLTPGKLAGLKSISDERGVIAALALDQRGILRSAIAKARNADDVPAAAVEEFKIHVTSALTVYASAILLDPEYGLPAAKHRNAAGLLVAYEQSCYDAVPPRMPILYDRWSVRRMKEAGADCIKVLLHYTPFDPVEINGVKRAFAERVGDECRANDIPFVLELLGYDLEGNEKTCAYARIKPEIVVRSVEEFSRERYGVDLLKIEVPVQMRFVAGTQFFCGQQACTRADAKHHFAAVAAATDKPFVYLSAGVSNAQFIETLELLAESGSRFNGVLCGRATWQDAVAVYAQHGAAALDDWLATAGRDNITRVNAALDAAQPWHAQFAMPAPAC
jgi:tagatose 1,6-diphosphate aldolase